MNDITYRFDDQDKHYLLNFELSDRFSPSNDIEINISSSEQYEKERNDCDNYRFYGNISLYGTNVLCEVDGENGYQKIIDLMDYDEDTDRFAKSEDEILMNDGGYYYYRNSFCEKIFLNPQPSVFDLSNDDEWEVFLTIPNKINTVDLTFNGVSLSDGISIYEYDFVYLDGKPHAKFFTVLEHNLFVGNKIRIYSSNNQWNKDFFVKQVEGGNIFLVEMDGLPTPSPIIQKMSFKRYSNGVLCEYHSIWCERLMTSVEVSDFAFATNIYGDKRQTLIFDDVVLKNENDAFGRPLAEVSLCVLKKENNIYSNSYFSINTYQRDIDYDYLSVYEGSQFNGLPSTKIFHSIIEKDNYNLIDTKLCDAFCAFNSQNRLDNGLFESYLYKYLFPIHIKEPSSYIESSETNDVGYGILQNGMYKWRYYYKKNLPFINVSHYARIDADLYIQRQDPCNSIGLGQNALILGKCIDNQISTIKNNGNFC